MQDIPLLPIILIIWSLFVIAAIVVGVKHFIALTGISDLLSYDSGDYEGWEDDSILESYDNPTAEPYVVGTTSKKLKIIETLA